MGKFEKISVGEANKWLRWISSLASDTATRRGTEGPNPLIPRQEYEMLAGFQAFYSCPSIEEFIMDKVGTDGLKDMVAKRAHREFGSKIDSLCATEAMFTVPMYIGRGCRYLTGLIKQGDLIDEVITLVSFWKAFSAGQRRDGKIMGWDAGYASQLLDQDVVERLRGEVEPLDAEKKKLVYKFNAAAQMQGFMNHFDNRLGLGDTGPYETKDRLILVRDCYVNEKVFHWSDANEGLPFSYTIVLTLDKKKMMEDRKSGKMKYFALYDTGTIFSDPFTYEHDVVLDAAVYSREEDDVAHQPQRIALADLPKHAEKCEEATIKLYQKLMKMSKFERMIAGMWVYAVSIMLPALRATNLYEEACEKTGLWEMHPSTLNGYTQVMERASILIPKIMAGLGAGPLPLS